MYPPPPPISGLNTPSVSTNLCFWATTWNSWLGKASIGFWMLLCRTLKHISGESIVTCPDPTLSLGKVPHDYWAISWLCRLSMQSRFWISQWNSATSLKYDSGILISHTIDAADSAQAQQSPRPFLCERVGSGHETSENTVCRRWEHCMWPRSQAIEEMAWELDKWAWSSYMKVEWAFQPRKPFLQIPYQKLFLSWIFTYCMCTKLKGTQLFNHTVCQYSLYFLEPQCVV